MSSLKKLAEEYPTAIIVTTEKDSQRVASFPYVPDILKERLFFAPIKAEFTTEKEKDRFMEVILPALG